MNYFLPVKANRKGLLEDGAREEGGPAPFRTGQIGRTMSHNRTVRAFRIHRSLLLLRLMFLLILALLADIFVGGKPQEGDIDVEEAKVKQQTYVKRSLPVIHRKNSICKRFTCSDSS